MKKKIIEIVNYVNSNEVSQSLETIYSELGKKKLRLVAIQLLGWLETQYNCRKKRPLKVLKNYSWYEGLEKWISIDVTFSEYFIVQDNYLDFSEKIFEAEQDEIRRIVYENYKAKLFITRQR